MNKTFTVDFELFKELLHTEENNKILYNSKILYTFYTILFKQSLEDSNNKDITKILIEVLLLFAKENKIYFDQAVNTHMLSATPIIKLN